VGALREQWASWVSQGRRQYHGRLETAAQLVEQQRGVQNSLQRQRELEADEDYKAQNCRCCPKCGRVVQKLAGCDSMRCGENYHGGDKQDGCGATFNWTGAPKYKPKLTRRVVPRLDIDRLKVEGKDARHFMVSCDHCGAAHIRGPRFRCVHCPSFNLCADCDFRAAAGHSDEHVFEIIFTPQHVLNLDLPIGTDVELVGLLRNCTLNGRHGVVRRYRPSRQLYDLQLREPLAEPLRADGGDSVSASEPFVVPDVAHAELLGVPARFVQLCVDSDVASAIEAVEVQGRARQAEWAALPEGQHVQVTGRVTWLPRPFQACPNFVGVECTVSNCGSSSFSRDSTAESELEDELALVEGPYVLASDRVTVSVARSGKVCTTESANVKPLVSSEAAFASLQDFQRSTQLARRLHLNLPVGQRVEFSGSVDGKIYQGAVAKVTEPYDPERECYTVRLWRAAACGRSPDGAAKARMAEQYGISDLLEMTMGELLDLWDHFGIPREGLTTADAFLEQAMSFLPAARPEPLTVPAQFLQPLIADTAELYILQERHVLALTGGSRKGATSTAL